MSPSSPIDFKVFFLCLRVLQFSYNSSSMDLLLFFCLELFLFKLTFIFFTSRIHSTYFSTTPSLFVNFHSRTSVKCILEFSYFWTNLWTAFTFSYILSLFFFYFCCILDVFDSFIFQFIHLPSNKVKSLFLMDMWQEST